MVKIENHLGVISISQEFFVNLVSYAASRCFGVAGMATSEDTLTGRLFKSNHPDKGVQINTNGGVLTIDLHIIVTYGVNISAIVKSIVNKVRYTVEQTTSLHVSRVTVYVDGMLS